MVAAIFKDAPVDLLDQLWKRLYRGDYHYWSNCNPHLSPTLTPWRPSMLENVENRSYECLFPCIMDMDSTYFDVVGYRRAHAQLLSDRKWYAMPSLGFLPTDVTNVIAGEGGLLVCDGGKQPRPHIPGEPPIPMADHWNKSLYPVNQSIMLICNPLTREFIYLPPLQEKNLHQKVAMITFEKTPSPRKKRFILRRALNKSSSTSAPGACECSGEGRGANKSMAAKLKDGHHYTIVIVGYHEEVSYNNATVESLVCAVYKSRFTGGWCFMRSAPGKARFMERHLGRTGIGFLTAGGTEFENGEECMGVCFGGCVVHKGLNRASPALFCVGAVRHDDTSRVFPFCPFGDESQLQPPIVVQPLLMVDCQIMFAVTRNVVAADTILVFEICMEHGVHPPSPNGSYQLATQMPSAIFQDAFQADSGFSIREFKCSGANGLICIQAKDSPTLAIYDIFSGQWFLENYTTFLPVKTGSDQRPSSYQMFGGAWRPSFHQRVLVNS